MCTFHTHALQQDDGGGRRSLRLALYIIGFQASHAGSTADLRAIGRSPRNGPLKFHDGVEEQMLEHVLSQVGALGAATSRAEAVLSAVDDFCWHQHWMMSIGDVKGRIMDDALQERLQRFSGRPDAFRALQFGTYVGYSGVRIARLLPPGAVLYSVDPDARMNEIARELAQLAAVNGSVEFLLATAAEAIYQLHSRKILLDFVLIDHVKDDYLPALQMLEGLLNRGATVVADNVLFLGTDSYLQYVRGSKFYHSRFVDAALEYTPDGLDGRPLIADGVEISTYMPNIGREGFDDL